MIRFYGYSQCDTCRKAKKWLEAQGKRFEQIDITLHPPSLEDLKEMVRSSGLSLKDFLNRSGIQYRERKMSEKLKVYSEDQILQLMAEEGRLIKRPLVTDGKQVTVGFSEQMFAEKWK